MRPSSKGDSTESDKQKTTNRQTVEVTDDNAVEEVDIAYENFKEIDPLDVSKEGTEAWETALKR